MSTSSSIGGGSGVGGGTSLLGGKFRHGVNFGYTPGWDDQQSATIARAAGADGARLSFPESHFDQWGYGIEVGDNAAYQTIGLHNNVAFLSGPTAAHSTAPTGGDTTHFIPKNLYEPIFLGDGSVNPDNYWANYVDQTMTTYKDYVKVYSVWNEPDWVADWQVTQDWDTTAPDASDLPRFNGSIYDYVRMLRITKEVAAHVDPSLKVAVGGLGYPSFLGAVLRYTDNPAGGAVSAEYPETGASYFDVVDMHYYPIFGGAGSSDVGVDGLLGLHAAFEAELTKAGAGSRPFIVTENGAPRVSVGGAPGGEAYARNYLLKSMTLAHADGIAGVDWFALSDGTDTSSSSFASMGLYESLASASGPDAAVRTPTGEAYRTLEALLEDALFDVDGTAALALVDPVRGAAFQTKDGKHAVVVWQRASGTDETASGALSMASDASWDRYEWDAAAHGMEKTTLSPAGGHVEVSLTSSPAILVEE